MAEAELVVLLAGFGRNCQFAAAKHWSRQKFLSVGNSWFSVPIPQIVRFASTNS